ncbi:flagellar hook-length control protein FliK [Bacillus sp. V59.32b]|uniref:flagellar hook-length control protein FliK n=1 Tax=Bacillus sp. V59.32b TaxID=1758642 RepID=UPI000E3D538A|nr:flagellar hook-length control protein FliK [Bacillus sp. V59.32b]RFU68862.1 flagellar hook-length control protein FliK [Bacillus sp. V59.32b]
MNAGLVIPLQTLTGTSSGSPSGSPVDTGNITGFGAVLTALSAAVKGDQINGQQQELSNEETALLQELAQFLQISSLVDLEGGPELGRDMLLEETPLESHPILESLLQGGMNKESLEKLVIALKETGQLNAGSIEKLVSSLKEAEQITEDSGTMEEDANTLFSMGLADIFSIVKAIASLNGEQLQKIDLDSASNVLKFAKLQVLLAEYKDMTAKEAVMNSELKSLLETISGKVQKLLGSNDHTLINSNSFAKELAGVNDQNITVPKLGSMNGQEINALKLGSANGQETNAFKLGSAYSQDANTLKQDTANNHESNALKLGSSKDESTNILKNVYTRLSENLNQKNASDTKSIAKENLPLKQMEVSQSQPVHFQVSKLEQLVLTVERAGQPVNQEQFIKAFQNILSKANFTSGNGMQKLFIKLNPEHLGSLRIEIIQKDSGLVATIMATTAKAKDLIEGQIQGLKHAFNGQNLQIEKIEVLQTMNSFAQERFLQRESDGSQQHEKEQKQQNNNQQEDPEAEFTADLEAALLSMKV